MKTAALIATLFLTGCASFGEQPSDTVVAGLHWYRDRPDFIAQRVEWNRVPASVFDQRCADASRGGSSACAIRINEGGQCIVLSLVSEDEAQRTKECGGPTLYDHELRHCGIGMPLPGGWRHREGVCL